jgi:hypothetical protein
LKNGLPPLGQKHGHPSSSVKRVDKTVHDSAEIVGSTFNFIEDLSLDNTPSPIWMTYELKGNLNYGSEATIAKYVSSVLDEIIVAVGQQGNPDC